MEIMERGYRSKLVAGGIIVEQPIQVCTSIVGGSQYQFTCFGLDQSDKIPDNKYVVFFKQAHSPSGEISLDDNSAKDSTFQLNLVSLPPNIKKLSFAIAAIRQSSIRDISTCTVQIMQNGQTAFSFEITGKDFQSPNGVNTIDIYEKDKYWRVNAIAASFKFPGGLEEIITHYGGDWNEVNSAPSSPDPVPSVREQQTKSKEKDTPRPSPPPRDPEEPALGLGKNAEGFDRTENDWV